MYFEKTLQNIGNTPNHVAIVVHKLGSAHSVQFFHTNVQSTRQPLGNFISEKYLEDLLKTSAEQIKLNIGDENISIDEPTWKNIQAWLTDVKTLRVKPVAKIKTV